MLELKLTYVVRCLVSLLLKKTYQIPIDKHIPSNSPKFIRSYNKDGGQHDNRCVSFWLMLSLGNGSGVGERCLPAL